MINTAYMKLVKARWDEQWNKPRLEEKMPLLNYKLNALEENKCGNCDSIATLTKVLELQKSKDYCALIYTCQTCLVMYDAKFELNSKNVYTIQTQWADNDEMYALPTTDEFEDEIERNSTMFDALQQLLGIKLHGTMLEIGAGSGMRAVAATRFFDEVIAYDHVTTRLNKLLENIPSKSIVQAKAKDLPSVSANVVLAWHVLEHLSEPGRSMHCFSKLLRDKGIILCQTPIMSKENVAPYHYYFQNEASYAWLAESCGLQLHGIYYDHDLQFMTAALIKV